MQAQLTNSFVENMARGVYAGTAISDLENSVQRAEGVLVPTKVPKIPVSFGAPPELYDRLTKTMTEVGSSMSEICRTALTSYLNELDGECEFERMRR